MARKSLWTFFILLIGVAILFGGGINQAYQNSAQEFDVTNETVSQNFDNLAYVDESDSADEYSETVTVYNATDYELTDGTDYDWYTNGSVQFYDTENTNQDNSATVTYSYTAQSESSEFGGNIATILGYLVVILLLYVAGKFALSAWGWD